MTRAKTHISGANSLKLRLGIGAALLGAVTLLTAVILFVGMARVADRLDAALASDIRMARYGVLSTQVSTFLVIATEAVQTGVPTDIRANRITPVADRIQQTFGKLQADVQDAVAQARVLGIDEQSRYGTQSLGLARMEAQMQRARSGLLEDTDDRTRLRAHLDIFSTGFDPLLSQAVNAERRFRNEILAGIERLRQHLTQIALGIAGLTVVMVAGFYLLLIRPLFQRLGGLRAAALQIGQEDFSVALPTTSRDEIGQLYHETNRMTAALAARQAEVQAEWARLSETIAQRTEELRAANATLEEVDENRRRFFADISHELRTPLTVILMEAQIGCMGSPDPKASFATIEARAARLNRRIDDLLRVARSDSGQLALETTQFDLAQMAVEVTEEVQGEIDNAGMTLTADQIPALSVCGDANWVRQVLVSLIRNAIRHAREGGVVHLSAEQTDDTAGLAVTDNGSGIAAEEQTHVFERFAQGGTANAQGFGVGLALARWVIEAQGGTIAVTSPLPRDAAIGKEPGTKTAVQLPQVNG